MDKAQMPDGLRVALVIGNSTYESASSLKNPSNDARAIAMAFTKIGFSGISLEDSAGGIPTVVPMLDLDHRQLREAIAAFARAADGAEQALMYYAGHGIEVGGQNYLVPVDARLKKISDVGFRTVALNELLDALAHSSGLKVVILDACRDNPFRNLMVNTRGLSRGLNRVEPANRDILVAYAAKHGTVALDESGGNNSPFTTAFLEHIEEPGLEIRNFFGEVRDSVLKITKNQQEPFLYGTLGRKQEYLVPAARGEDIRARALWSEIKASDDPLDYEGFLAEFPESPFAPLAVRNAERFIRAANDVGVLKRIKANYPSSQRVSLVDRKIADILESLSFATADTEPVGRFRKNSPTHFPTYEIFVGIVAAVLSSVTLGVPLPGLDVFRGGFSTSGFAKIHTGIIFGTALLICMRRLGLKRRPEFVGLVSGALVLWIIYVNAYTLIVIRSVLAETSTIAILAEIFCLGFMVAALLSISTQWLCDRIVVLRSVAITALMGGVASFLLPLDVRISNGGFWLTFLAWEPAVLASLSITMRDRMLKSTS
jgi:hypothetical protein